MQANNRSGITLSVAILIATALILLLMGREPICTCGTVKFWHGAVVSSENSQHISDWYTLSHLAHGVLFYGLAHLVLGRFALHWRLAAATLIEAAWEIVENTDMIINRYREATIALDYFGDSVLNSSSDIVAMWIGFWITSRLPVWASIAFLFALEGIALYAIRDGLALNILMLTYPLEAVRVWQAGG